MVCGWTDGLREEGWMEIAVAAPHTAPRSPARTPPPPKTAQDDIVYSMVIEEFDAEKGGWLPYKADDVQLEFVMLDPYVRTFLQHDGQGRFAKLFKIPDVYGVYKFRVMYRRPGLSTLAVNTQVRACVGGVVGGLWGLGGRPCPWWR